MINKSKMQSDVITVVEFLKRNNFKDLQRNQTMFVYIDNKISDRYQNIVSSEDVIDYIAWSKPDVLSLALSNYINSKVIKCDGEWILGSSSNPRVQAIAESFVTTDENGAVSNARTQTIKQNVRKFYKDIIAVIELLGDDYGDISESEDLGILTEANKYFFGTENTNEVKKLFESVEENKKEYYASMFRGLQHASADYMNKKLITPISGFYEFQNWGVTLDASPIFGISKYIQNVNSEDLYTKYMSWYLFTHVFYLVMRACDEHSMSSGIKFDFLEYWWDLCGDRSIKSGEDKKFLKLFAKVFDSYYGMTFNQEKQVPSPVKKIVYKAISENV